MTAPDRTTWTVAEDPAGDLTLWYGDTAVLRRFVLGGAFAPHADLLWQVLTRVLARDEATIERLARAQVGYPLDWDDLGASTQDLICEGVRIVLAVLWLLLTRRRPRIRGVDAGQPHVVTSRGFKHMEPIPSAYGGEVDVYESSAASSPHVWLNVTCPSDLNDRNSAPIEAIAHLRLDDAARLRDQLTYLIEHHYQLEQR